MGPLLLLAAHLFLLGCNDPSELPTETEQTYGAAIDATDAIPAPAVAAEPDRYLGQRVTIDGRIRSITDEGCTLHLEADGESPLRVEAARRANNTCAWQLPSDSDGFVVAAGTLQVQNDSLRILSNGLQKTPMRIDTTDP